MSFIDTLFSGLEALKHRPAVTEVHGSSLVPTTGAELAELVARARGSVRARGLQAGERVVLLAPNSARWVAADLALLAEGAVVVPLYARQDPAELVAMMHDCAPSLVLCATEALASGVSTHWPEASIVLFDALFEGEPVREPPVSRAPEAPVTIVYTSGTSGEPKGVINTVANVDFMLPRTAGALEAMMGPSRREHRVFHYLPFCFSGSRVVLWTCLFRANGIMISTDLTQLTTELAAARPNYLLNVPALLERIRSGVDDKVRARGRAVAWLYDRAVEASLRERPGKRDRLTLALARRLIFSKIRQQLGPELECLICGSAPLSEDTQRWFGLLDWPVYQVYGLTETTAIVTMDRPPRSVPGWVGSVIDGVEVKLGEGGELLVRGPNVFAGYWERPGATADAFDGEWFRTGDCAEIDASGLLRIVGRAKNLLVPTSGHNVAPEPLEQLLVGSIPGVEQAVVVGHARPWLAALLTGEARAEDIEAHLARINENLPHYRRIRAWHLCEEPFTIENGLLTANQKLRRREVEARYADAIDALYARDVQKRGAVA